MEKTLFLLGFLMMLTSCEKTINEENLTEGYKPIYMDYNGIHQISSIRPVNMVNTGKIYLYQNCVFVNERGRGVHVIDNSNPQNPRNIKFINIPGNYDISIKNNILYADNTTDLVAINISNLDSVYVTKRIPNVYQSYSQMFPEFVNGYFECVDTTKGFVVGWYKTMLNNPKCFR